MKRLVYGVRIPALPSKGKSSKYQSKPLELKHEDGTTAYFWIIPTKVSAGNFIVNQLQIMNFPLAAEGYNLNCYKDPRYGKDYVEDMKNWESDPYNFDDDVHTDFYASGKYYSLGSDTTLEQAIMIYRALDNVYAMIHNNAYDTQIYNGWIYFDEEYGQWYASIDKPDGADEYQWRNYYGTQIEIYPREGEV